MDALSPIAGISLERYADLAAKMSVCNGDLQACAALAEREGVDGATWQAAMDGWNERMSNPATAGTVAIAYMPLYQAALARTGPSATCSFEDYVVMMAMISAPAWGLDSMYAHFGIDAPKWSQLGTHWVAQLTGHPQLGARFAAEKQRILDHLRAGGAPPPPSNELSPYDR